MSLSSTIITTTHQSSSHSSSSNASSSSKGVGGQACAACKYQRRKCAADCALAPYFPQERQRQFLNAHRLFGVSNITKLIKNLDPRAKDDAMRSIIFQSDARASDPVGGCYRIVRDLQRQVDVASAELESLSHHLSLFRAASFLDSVQPPPATPHHDDVASWVLLHDANDGRSRDDDDVVERRRELFYSARLRHWQQ